MELLTYLTANRIEEILQQLDSYLADIGQSFLRAGMGWAAAGRPSISGTEDSND